MASGNAELNYKRRKADAYPQQGRKSGARPAYSPYEPPKRTPEQTAPLRNELDYHPEAPLKTLTPAEIRAIVLVIFVVTAIAMGIVLLSAQATVTQKEINDLRKNIAQVDDDITNLKIEIEQAQEMQNIKEQAKEKFGMREPAFDQYVYVSELPEAQSDFGRYIREKTYLEMNGAQTQDAEPETEE